MQTSPDTLLRRVVQAPEETEHRTRHVGIDEWAWHRGHRYGTLIVNLDTHRPLLASVMQISADTLLLMVVQAPEQAESLTRHVGIDERAWHRGHRYGTLIVNLHTHRPIVLLPGREQRRIQVADRWHLLKNIGDALERVMHPAGEGTSDYDQTTLVALLHPN